MCGTITRMDVILAICQSCEERTELLSRFEIGMLSLLLRHTLIRKQNKHVPLLLLSSSVAAAACAVCAARRHRPAVAMSS